METRETVKASLWRAKPIEALDREELYDIIAYMQNSIEDYKNLLDRITSMRK